MRGAAGACLLLLLSSCGGEEGPAPEEERAAAAPPTVLEGRIQGWDRGAGYTIAAQMAPVGGQGLKAGPVLTSGAVDMAGSFRIELPGGQALAPYLGVLDHTHMKHRNCTVDIHTEPTPLFIALLVLSVSDGTTRHVIEQSVPGPNDEPGARFTLVTYFYSPVEARVTGVGTCTDESSGSELLYDWTVSTGWNTSIDRYEFDDFGLGVSSSRLLRRSAPPPPGAAWTLN